MIVAQSYLTLCNSMNCSVPGSFVHGILQKRLLEWVAISFSNGQGIVLDSHDIEWFSLEMNRDHAVIFETAPKYCILDSFVDYDGYSLSSKGFLPSVVDIMVI